MTEAEIQNILEKQHKFFQTGQTLPVAYRIEQLQKLKDSIIRHEPDLNLALKADLGKSETESYMCEIGLTLSELSWMLKHIKKLTKETVVPTPLAQFAAKSFRSPSPYGNVLIMSPWNYPDVYKRQLVHGRRLFWCELSKTRFSSHACGH